MTLKLIADLELSSKEKANLIQQLQNTVENQAITIKSMDLKIEEQASIINNLNLDYESFNKNTTYIYSVSDCKLHLFSNINEHRLLATFSETEYIIEEQEIFTIPQVLEIMRINCAALIKNPQLKNGPCLGYILRGNNCNDLLLPSKLWLQIEKMLYKPPYIKEVEQRKHIYELYADIDYIVAMNYVQNYKYGVHILPFAQQFKQLFILEKQLINNICNRLKGNIDTKNPIFYNYCYPFNLNIRDVKSYVYKNRHLNIEFYYNLLKTPLKK